jgi:hypothetical protein
MADPNQTPQRADWVCPCTGCQKARKKAFKEIIDIIDSGGDAYSRIDTIRKFINKNDGRKNN